MTPGQVVLFIIGSIVVIFGAYYMTYFIAKRGSKMQGSRLIRVVDRTSLSKDKMICAVEVRGKVYLLALTDGAAAVIDTMEAKEFHEAAGAAYSKPDMGAVSNILFSGFASVKNSRMWKDRMDFSKEQRTSDSRLDNLSGFSDSDEPEGMPRDTEEARQVRFAGEEDKIDDLYRRIQSRKTRGGPKGGGE